MAGFTLNTPTVDGDIKKVEEYLYRLDKQLRYMFSNIDPEDNYSAAALIKSADANNRIEVNEKAIIAEAKRASDAEGNLSARIDVNASSITSEITRATSAEGTLSSRITQNAEAITLKVSTDSLVSTMNSQLQITGKSINLTTGHFTIDSTNFKVNASGDVNITGEMEADKFISTAGGVKVYAEGDRNSYIEIDSVIAHYDPISRKTTYTETTIGKWDGSGLNADNYHIQQNGTEMYYWQESWWDHYGDMRMHDISFINLDYTLDPEQPDKERELTKTLRQYLYDFEDRITALERR